MQEYSSALIIYISLSDIVNIMLLFVLQGLVVLQRGLWLHNAPQCNYLVYTVLCL
jgi:hypothetical protein